MKKSGVLEKAQSLLFNFMSIHIEERDEKLEGALKKISAMGVIVLLMAIAAPLLWLDILAPDKVESQLVSELSLDAVESSLNYFLFGSFFVFACSVSLSLFLIEVEEKLPPYKSTRFNVVDFISIILFLAFQFTGVGLSMFFVGDLLESNSRTVSESTAIGIMINTGLYYWLLPLIFLGLLSMPRAIVALTKRRIMHFFYMAILVGFAGVCFSTIVFDKAYKEKTAFSLQASGYVINKGLHAVYPGEKFRDYNSLSLSLFDITRDKKGLSKSDLDKAKSHLLYFFDRERAFMEFHKDRVEQELSATIGLKDRYLMLSLYDYLDEGLIETIELIRSGREDQALAEFDDHLIYHLNASLVPGKEDLVSALAGDYSADDFMSKEGVADIELLPRLKYQHNIARLIKAYLDYVAKDIK